MRTYLFNIYVYIVLCLVTYIFGMYVFLDSLYNVAYMYSIIWHVCIHLTIRCIADLFIYVAIHNCVCV